jgi:hypothetical protein
MPPSIRFLLDEHLRGVLWNAIERHNRTGGLLIDATRVGDPADLPLGSDDAAILAWAERENRVLLTLDRHTMSGNLVLHLAAGNHSPGVFILDPSSSVAEIIDLLELIGHAGDPADYLNHVEYVP